MGPGSIRRSGPTLKGNPHGPNVVSPGVHGSENLRPVTPGPVDSDPDTQSTAETEHLVESVPSAAAPVVDPEA